MANLACSSQLPRLTRPETIATQAMTNLKKKLVVIEVITIVKFILAFKSEIHALQIWQMDSSICLIKKGLLIYSFCPVSHIGPFIENKPKSF